MTVRATCTCIVGLDVNVTATEIIVALKAGQIKFTFLTVFMTLRKSFVYPKHCSLIKQPEDLTTTPSLLQQYKSGLKEIITEASLENRRCILLPKYVFAHKFGNMISLIV